MAGKPLFPNGKTGIEIRLLPQSFVSEDRNKKTEAFGRDKNRPGQRPPANTLKQSIFQAASRIGQRTDNLPNAVEFPIRICHTYIPEASPCTGISTT